MAPRQPARPPIGRFYELQQEVEIPEDYVLTDKIRIKPQTRSQMIVFRTATTPEEVDRAFFGDAYDAVLELFADKPDQLWKKFVDDVSAHFLGPGVEEEPGKAEPSPASGESTSS